MHVLRLYGKQGDRFPFHGRGHDHPPAQGMHLLRQAVQAVEAAGNLVIAAVLCLYGEICRRNSKKPKSLQVYLILYAVFRFALEYVRYDDSERGILMGLSTSQWISIVICTGVIAVEIFRQKKSAVKILFCWRDAGSSGNICRDKRF